MLFLVVLVLTTTRLRLFLVVVAPKTTRLHLFLEVVLKAEAQQCHHFLFLAGTQIAGLLCASLEASNGVITSTSSDSV